MNALKSTFFSFLFVFVFSLSAQEDMTVYRAKVKEAYQLYQAEEYKKSADTYAEAFASIGRKAYSNDRYNAACSYALAGEKDSALFHLYRLADGMKYDNLGHLTKDKDLLSLHDEKRWEEIVAYVKANKEEKEKNYNMELVNQLDTIRELDQGMRIQSQELQKKHSWDSPEMKELWKKIQVQDSINEIAVTAILDEYGWLGADIIGDRGNGTLFLVIQHAPLETQEKYLPMMREAVKDGRARGSSLALLEDRVNLRKGRKQIYGSQIRTNSETGENYVRALEDPMNVNERRASVGLGKLEDYVARWNIEWDAEEYIKNISVYEERLSKTVGK